MTPNSNFSPIKAYLSINPNPNPTLTMTLDLAPILILTLAPILASFSSANLPDLDVQGVVMGPGDTIGSLVVTIAEDANCHQLLSLTYASLSLRIIRHGVVCHAIHVYTVWSLMIATP